MTSLHKFHQICFAHNPPDSDEFVSKLNRISLKLTKQMFIVYSNFNYPKDPLQIWKHLLNAKFTYQDCDSYIADHGEDT